MNTKYSQHDFNNSAQPDSGFVMRQMGFQEDQRQLGAVPVREGWGELDNGSSQMGGYQDDFIPGQMG